MSTARAASDDAELGTRALAAQLAADVAEAVKPQ